MNRIRVGLMGMVMLLLGACQQDGAPPSTSGAAVAPGAAPMGFSCPPAGTRVSFGGNPIVFNGTDPNDAFVCLATNPNGSQVRRMMNWFVLPLDNERPVREGVARLWPLEPGKTASFVFIGRAANMSTFQYREDWRVVGAQRSNVAGANREIIVIERRQRGMLENNYDGTDTLWFDPVSRVIIRRSVVVNRGQAAGGNFTATMIEVPAAQPR